MANKSSGLIVVAIITAAALIGLALFKRAYGPVQIPDDAYFVAAAVIVLLPVVTKVLRKVSRRVGLPGPK